MDILIDGLWLWDLVHGNVSNWAVDIFQRSTFTTISMFDFSYWEEREEELQADGKIEGIVLDLLQNFDGDPNSVY